MGTLTNRTQRQSSRSVSTPPSSADGGPAGGGGRPRPQRLAPLGGDDEPGGQQAERGRGQDGAAHALGGAAPR